MQFQKLILGYKLFTYFVIKNEYTYVKLKYDGSMIDYVYGSETSKIWWCNKWTAPYLLQ